MFGKNSSPKATGEHLSIIASETLFSGDIRTRGSVRIDGKLEGNITGAKQVVIGENGEIKGSIEAESLVVGGKVFGHVKTQKFVRLLTHGHLEGDLKTASLHIEEGARFDGTCTMRDGSDHSPRLSGQHTATELFDSNKVLTPLLK